MHLRPTALAALAAALLATGAAHAEAAAGYACRIHKGADGKGATVEIANCLPGCETAMTEACCIDIAKLGAMNGLGFKLSDNDLGTRQIWNQNFLNTGKNACVFSSPGRFTREGAIRPEGSGVRHVIFEGTPRNSCDGGETLQKGTMVHFACTNVQAEPNPSGGGFKSARLSNPSKPTVDCSFDIVKNRTLVKELKSGFFHLPRGISDTAESKTGNATLSDKELAGLASDLEGQKGILGQLNSYDPAKHYFRVEVKGQASCGVGTDPKILEYCKPSRASQQTLATNRSKNGYAAYPKYLAAKAGWKLVSSSAAEVALSKTLGGKLVNIKVVSAGAEVKECKADSDCRAVQGVTSLVFKRGIGG